MYRVLLFFLFLWHSGTISYAETRVGGHLKYQLSGFQADSDSLTALLGSKQYEGHEFDLRLKTSGDAGFKRFDWELDGELLGSGGRDRQIQNRVSDFVAAPFIALTDDDRRLVDLSHDVVDDDQLKVTGRVDRASVRFVAGDVVLKVGRQAVTWGNGLVFQVMDLFNPFSPVEIDKDYKSGDDLLYAQYLTSSAGDVQLLVLPRRDLTSSNIEHDESSYAVKYHHSFFESGIDVDALYARHFNDSVYGLGGAASIAGAVFRADLVGTRVQSEDTELSAVFNVDRGFTLFGVNTYLFVEYFRNGFGSDDSTGTNLSPLLLERLARSEIFSLGRDMLAAGGRIEASPRHNVYLSQLINVHDSSGFFQYRSDLDLYEDVSLLLGMSVPYGTGGSEFGGLELPATGSFLSPSASVYARMSYYF